MTAADADPRDAARAVADELRRLATLLVGHVVPADELADLAATLSVANERVAETPDRSDAKDHDELGSLRGAANPVAPPLVFLPSGAGNVVAAARLGAAYEGPPGRVHGGWLAAMFDEVLAVLQRDAGVDGVTAELDVRYRVPAPIDAELRFDGAIDEDAGRSVFASATCRVEGELVADARARFVRGELRKRERG